mmetsp:Transcript_51887/g.112813  ORF Transcript_51887/g.112813 Transcript_51887/m.112813 type:complete len:646 (+) Transcript_51887:212-2149(+)|eukprot:CAMPEP_0206564182 /NCGR_PEP_ID=MMETSP0325_2-20121206/23308_1 /ASSEMBLY_ACC=CAM_ASM_000347 /TAXON_ID=2866 /ORGANISM="Crypthecodinium cohnii, Strain Seligo" /LENGTH=645 /DNA_ID=CAMNT_0054066767 /DNA_START=212 /DNA_END=2149 /DNA_ORIENTATION=-
MPSIQRFLSTATIGAQLVADDLTLAGQFITQEAKQIGQFLETHYNGIEGLDSKWLAKVFEDTYSFTALKAWKWFPPQDGKSDGTIYTSTGDIPQMWLRDSSAQMMPYVHSAANPEGEAVRKILEAAMKRQILFILDDPYGSAFFDSHGESEQQGPNKNECPKSENCPTCGCTRCKPACGLYTYQKDFELDSPFYVLLLHYRYWKATGRTEHFDENFAKALTSIYNLLRIEQYHKTKSDYFYKDLSGDFEEGIGLIWSFAIPSDDQAVGYNIPQNLMGVVVLRQASEIATTVLKNNKLAQDLKDLALEVENAIAEYGIVEDASGAKVYAYSVNGFKGEKAHNVLMDDANMPNLLWIPYLGYTGHDDIYTQTRRDILSEESDQNYFVGPAPKWFKGLGSRHTTTGLRPLHPGAECWGECIWPLGLIMEGMTATDPKDKVRIMKAILSSTAGQTVLHEGFLPSDPTHYNRDLFGWANALFSEWVFRQWAHPTLRNEGKNPQKNSQESPESSSNTTILKQSSAQKATNSLGKVSISVSVTVSEGHSYSEADANAQDALLALAASPSPSSSPSFLGLSASASAAAKGKHSKSRPAQAALDSNNDNNNNDNSDNDNDHDDDEDQQPLQRATSQLHARSHSQHSVKFSRNKK